MDFLYKYDLFYFMLTHEIGPKKNTNWLLNNNNNINKWVGQETLHYEKSRLLKNTSSSFSWQSCVVVWNIILIKEDFYASSTNCKICVCIFQRHSIVVMWHSLCHFKIQVSLAICGGYVPEKVWSVNTKTAILGLTLWKFPSYLRVFTVFWPVNSQNRE